MTTSTGKVLAELNGVSVMAFGCNRLSVEYDNESVLDIEATDQEQTIPIRIPNAEVTGRVHMYSRHAQVACKVVLRPNGARPQEIERELKREVSN